MSDIWVPPNGLWPHRWETVGWGAADVVTGLTVTRTQASAAISGGTVDYATAVSGDLWSFYVPLDSGTWTFMWMWTRFTDAGSVDVTLNGAAIASNVNQNGALAYNQVTTATGITVATPGVKTLTFTVDSGGTTVMRSQLITLVRTGA